MYLSTIRNSVIGKIEESQDKVESEEAVFLDCLDNGDRYDLQGGNHDLGIEKKK